MKSPLISICIPTYNQVDYLKKILDSVLSQTFEDYEIIISDDSTNDDISDLSFSHPLKEKIKYSKNEPSLGSPSNWNNALDKANGQYIKIIHHDDWLTDKDSLQKFISSFQKNPDASLIFCASKTNDFKTYKNGIYEPSSKEIRQINRNPKCLLIGNTIGAPSVIFFKKTQERFDTNLKWLVDTDFYIRILKKGPLIFIKEPLVYITTQSSQQVTSQCQNIETEFGEWFYVFKKHRQNKLFKISEILFLSKLIYRYKVISYTNFRKQFPDTPNRGTFRVLIFLNKMINLLRC